jgi:1-acyl-sn-glycerol-3-phosphate acyltransferase
MSRRLERLSRVSRTGLAFAAFGVGALAIAGLAFPLLRVVSATRDQGERRAQRLVHLSFRVFTRLLTRLGLISLTQSGLERLRQSPPAVVVSNHPTLIDVVLLIAAMPQADCVVKQAVWRNRFLRGVARGAGYLPNSEGPALVEACVERLRQGRWLLLFPEGTRSPRGHLGAFHRGAAHIALRVGCEVLPVVIRCEPPTLGRGEPWYRVPDRTVEISIALGGPRRPAVVAADGPRAAREWTTELRAFYEAHLSPTGATT